MNETNKEKQVIQLTIKNQSTNQQISRQTDLSIDKIS